MTIKVCHNKFNQIKNMIGKIILIFVYLLPMIILILGIYAFYIVDEGLGTFGIIMGVMAILFAWLLVPWMILEDNIFQKLNKKLKLFGWNEDC